MFNGELHFDSWWHFISAHQELLDELHNIIKNLKIEYETKQILPEKSKLFRAFREVKMDNCKYVLLGMDPYPNIYKGEPSACGLSFVTENGYTNPSLRILCKSLNIEPSEFKNKMLSNEVLLLNSALSLEQGKSGSHLKLWALFTRLLITFLSFERKDIKWILLGKDAQKFKQYIANKDNVLEAPHPVSYVYSGNTDYTELKELFQKLNFC